MAFRVLTVLLILCLVFSFLFVAVESGHECEEHDCPICKILAVVTRFLGVSSALVFVLLCVRVAVSTLPQREEDRFVVSPVDLKVELLN